MEADHRVARFGKFDYLSRIQFLKVHLGDWPWGRGRPARDGWRCD